MSYVDWNGGNIDTATTLLHDRNYFESFIKTSHVISHERTSMFWKFKQNFFNIFYRFYYFFAFAISAAIPSEITSPKI